MNLAWTLSVPDIATGSANLCSVVHFFPGQIPWTLQFRIHNAVTTAPKDPLDCCVQLDAPILVYVC